MQAETEVCGCHSAPTVSVGEVSRRPCVYSPGRARGNKGIPGGYVMVLFTFMFLKAIYYFYQCALVLASGAGFGAF